MIFNYNSLSGNLPLVIVESERPLERINWVWFNYSCDNSGVVRWTF